MQRRCCGGGQGVRTRGAKGLGTARRRQSLAHKTFINRPQPSYLIPLQPLPIPRTSPCSGGETQMPGGHVTWSPGIVSPCWFSTPSIDVRWGFWKCSMRGLSLPPQYGETEVQCVSTLYDESAWGKKKIPSKERGLNWCHSC